MLDRLCSAVALALLVMLAGCSGDRGDPAGMLCSGPGCSDVNPGGGGGTKDGGTDGGTDGGSPTSVDVTGSVELITSTTFAGGTTFAGNATITAPGAAGGDVTADFIAGQFSLLGAAPGVQWLLVTPAVATGALDTYSPSTLSDGAAIVLPVLSLDVMLSVNAMTSAGLVQGGTAQVVLQVLRNGSPLAGVALTSIVSGAVVAYDQGAGYYAETTATGDAGFVLVQNLPVAAKSTLTLDLSDANSAIVQVPVVVAPNAVTLAALEFP